MLDDVRFALRQLRKNPGFSVIAIATLGLGIGAAAGIFGLIQSVLLSPPPYVHPDRLVLIAPARADGVAFDQGATIGEWLAWRRATTFDPPALYRWTFNFLVRDDGSESLGGMRALAVQSLCRAEWAPSAAQTLAPPGEFCQGEISVWLRLPRTV